MPDVEHNRWNIEQLSMNFRPLTEEEQSAVIEKRQDKGVDVAARAYDEGLTTLLSGMYDKLKS